MLPKIKNDDDARRYNMNSQMVPFNYKSTEKK